MSDELSIPTSVLLARLASFVSQDTRLLALVRAPAQEFLEMTAPGGKRSGPARCPKRGRRVSVQPGPFRKYWSRCPGGPASAHRLAERPGHRDSGCLVPAADDRREQPAAYRGPLPAQGGRGTLGGNPAAQYPRRVQLLQRDRAQGPGDHRQGQDLGELLPVDEPPHRPHPRRLQLWEDVAGCFEAVAMAVGLLRQVIEKGDEYRGFLEKAIDLTAEAQSALRMAVDTVDAKPDNDQFRLFKWLRQMALEQQVYVQRYMRLDDPADPTHWHDLQERIGQLDSEIEEIRQRDKQRTKLLKKGQYHARLIREGKGAGHDWSKVIESVETLVGQGVPASDVDLREMLVPIVDDLPESSELPDGFQQVLSEVDRHLATQSPAAPHVVREVSEDVRKAASLYQGKTMVLIGGDRRPNAYEALKSAFGLKELIWVVTREHESTEVFVPYISRPDVNVVLLAIRWSSHSYGDVKGICDKFGKEFFRLPAGYNPNQVAHQILQQRGSVGA